MYIYIYIFKKNSIIIYPHLCSQESERERCLLVETLRSKLVLCILNAFFFLLITDTLDGSCTHNLILHLALRREGDAI
jgi:hypothetical protein